MDCTTPIRSSTLPKWSTPPPQNVSAIAPRVSPHPKPRIVVGDIVEVESRTWPGINKPGGVGKITKCNPDGTYNVNYVLGGSERKVDPVFIRPTASFMQVQQRQVKERDFFIHYDQKKAVRRRSSAKSSTRSHSPASSIASSGSNDNKIDRSSKSSGVVVNELAGRRKERTISETSDLPPAKKARLDENTGTTKIKLRLSHRTSSQPASPPKSPQIHRPEEIDDLERPAPRKPRSVEEIDDLERPAPRKSRNVEVRRKDKENELDGHERSKVIVQLKKRLLRLSSELSKANTALTTAPCSTKQLPTSFTETTPVVLQDGSQVAPLPKATVDERTNEIKESSAIVHVPSSPVVVQQSEQRVVSATTSATPSDSTVVSRSETHGVVAGILRRKQKAAQIEQVAKDLVQRTAYLPMTRETTCMIANAKGTHHRKRSGRGASGTLYAQLELQKNERTELAQRFTLEHNKAHKGLMDALHHELSRDQVTSLSRLELACLCINKNWRPMHSGKLTNIAKKYWYRRVGKQFLRVRDAMLERQRMEAAILHAKQQKELLSICSGLTPQQIEQQDLCPIVSVQYSYDN